MDSLLNRVQWGWLSPISLRAVVPAVLVVAITVSGCGGEETASTTDDPGTTTRATGPAEADEPAADASSQDDTDPESTDDGSTSDEPALPVTVIDATGAEVTVTSADRIIPLDGTVAEVVFALGMGDRVVATDLSATYPPEADALPEIGYQRALSAEPIATFEPTVLLATDIAGPPATLDELRTLGYPLVIVPNDATADGPGRKIRAVAEALGVSRRGDELASEVDRAIAEASVPEGESDDRPKVAALYVRGTSAQLVLGRDSATHWLIAAAGGVDIADELDIDDAAPVTAEAILLADPDVLLVPAAGLASVDGIDGLLEIEGLAQTSAGRTGRVLAYDDQLLLGNGPRIGGLLAELRAELAAVARP